MSKASVARRIASSAAYGGTGVVGVGLGTYVLLLVEANIARHRVGTITEVPFRVDGDYGRSGRLDAAPTSPPIKMLVLGDSAAAGLGAADPADTPAVVVATGLSRAARRPVELRNIAVVGAMSSDLDGQLDRLREAAPDWVPDIALMMVGANDVTHRVLPAASVRHLDQTVRRLRQLGAEVVLGACPDLGTVRPIPHPLRHVGRSWSRRLAAAQTICVVEAGGRSVSLGDLLGPEFRADPGSYFSEDQFHPSSLGYRRCGEVLLPSVCDVLGVGQPEERIEARAAQPLRVLPVAEAAVAAAERAGTEVAATQVAGQDRSREGRWAAVRRRLPLIGSSDFPEDVGTPAEPARDSEGEPEVSESGDTGLDSGVVAQP
jgi:lysophospholipase L1-like esterase